MANNLAVNNCNVGINMTDIGNTGSNVGSITLVDSTISNTPIGVLTGRDSTSSPPAAGNLIMENVDLHNVTTAVEGPGGAVYRSGSPNIIAWGQGHKYLPNEIGRAHV